MVLMHVLPCTQGEVLYEHLKCDFLDLHIIPNAGHAPYCDKTKEFCESVIHFIDKPHQNFKTIFQFFDSNIAYKIKQILLEKCFGSFFLLKTNKMIKLQYELFSKMINKKST